MAEGLAILGSALTRNKSRLLADSLSTRVESCISCNVSEVLNVSLSQEYENDSAELTFRKELAVKLATTSSEILVSNLSRNNTVKITRVCSRFMSRTEDGLPKGQTC